MIHPSPDEETSKFMAYVLRHEPQAIGLELDAEGWIGIDALIDGAARAHRLLTREAVLSALRNTKKQRFEVSEDGRKIRALQGHSSAQVRRDFEPIEPPDVLYHGTATRFMASIERGGLRPGNRHYVHLSADVETAILVGSRHGKAHVYTVAAGRMHAEGHVFHRAENGVWLTRAVPRAFLEDHEPKR